MARPKKTHPAEAASASPVIPSNSLVASAVRYPGKVPRIHSHSGEGWQRECYRHYAICGEARFAARFFGHALSRAFLNVSRQNSDGTNSVVRDGEVYGLLSELFNGRDGQAQMLESIGIHLTIAGECYLIGRTVKGTDADGNEFDQGEVWEIVSVLEVKVSGQQWAISYGDGFADIPLADDDVVIRIWNPNPAKRIEADSPFRSLLPILSEIEWLTRHIFAQTSSRLAGAGILFMPQEMTFPPPPEGEGKAVPANTADAMMLTLGNAMMESLKGDGSPEEVIPIIVTAPAEAIDKARLMTFWSELDAASLELRSEAIRRFAVGMDLPAEQVLGMSSNDGTGGGNSNGVSHWGAWQIEEATIKMHIEPMLDLVINALTVSYIRPQVPDATDMLTYDSSALRLRPDRSREAMELFQMGAISLEKMLLENGFDPADVPEAGELRTFFLKKIASGSATPEQVEAALEALGIELNSKRFGELPSEPRETRPDPSLEDHPTRPRNPGDDARPDLDPALLAASEGLVLRALEKAGNRVLNANGTKRGKERDRSINPLEAHCHQRVNGQGPTLLAGAFSTAPIALADHEGAEEIVASLEEFCLDLFEDQRTYSRSDLAEHLKASGACS